MLKLGFLIFHTSSVITFHIHTHCILLTMDTCTNHIYTTLYVALSDYIGDYSSDYMFTTLLLDELMSVRPSRKNCCCNQK